MFLRISTSFLVVIALMLGGCIKRPLMPPPERVEPVAEVSAEPEPFELCSADQGAAYGYLKRVVLVGFGVDNHSQAIDLKDIESLYPLELRRRLDLQQRFIMSSRGEIRLGQTSLDLLGAERSPGEQAAAIALEESAQFVIAGRFFDLAASYHDNVFMTAVKWPRRQLGAEIEVYDGYSGVLIARHHYQDQVEGEVDMRDYRPLQGEFFTSDYGQAFDRLLKQQVKDVVNDLACLPMQARIIKVDGKQLHIDVGVLSRLRPGDELKVIRQRISGRDLSDREIVHEKPYGTMVIQRVFPATAVGSIEVDKGSVNDLRPSDLVRAW